MPAGKIWIPRSKRVRRRRASGFKKAVRAIAKKAVMSQAETKTGVVSQTTSFGSSGTFLPIWSTVSQGTAQNNREGDEIQSLGVKIRGHIRLEPTVITGLREWCGYRMMVVSGKRPLTSSDMPLFKGAVDPEVLTVHYDRYFKFSSTNYATFLNKYIKFKRNVKYAGATVAKNELYVWLVPIPEGTGLTTTTGYGAVLDYQQYYKDI